MYDKKELKVIYGMYDMRPEREEARWSFEYIMGDFADIRKRYISLGFHLAEFRRYKYYEDFGYPSFEEFCAANVPLDKGAVSRCINVYEEFGARDSLSSASAPKMFLDNKYKDYSYSQLVEMLPLDKKRRKLVTPEMSVKSIRELKKKCLLSDDVVKNFVERCMPDRDSFTREELVDKFHKCGASWSSSLGGSVSYQFRPNKVTVNSHDDYYTFAQIIDKYASIPGNKLVATSQLEAVDPDELVPLFSSEQLDSDDFIIQLFDRIKNALEFLSLDIQDIERSGKQLSFKDLDGNSYSLLYRVSKKKEN